MAGEHLNSWLTYGLLLAIGISGGLGDIWIYKWSKSGDFRWLLISCVVWLLSLMLFAILLKWDNRSFSAAFILSSISHVILVLVCDLIYFGGRLSRLEWAGIGLSFIAICLLELGREAPAIEVPSSPSATDPDGSEQSTIRP